MKNSEFERDDNKSHLSASVAAAHWLFILLGVSWLLFAVWSVTRLVEYRSNLSSTMLGFIALLMLINAAILFWIGWGIGKGLRLHYYFGIIVLAGNIFLTLTDEFGVFDLIVLIIAVGLMLLLIITRSQFLTN